MADLLALFRTFTRTVEAGSFTAVAREFHSSQPTISRQIALLEDHLGSVLLQRTTRAVTLTDDGRLFYELARRTLDAAAEAESAVGRRKGRPSGRLTLAASGVFGRLHVIPRLPRFRALYPDIAISLQMSDGFTDLVEEGIDLALRIGETESSQLIMRRIGGSRRAVVATADYLARQGEPRHPNDLAEHECVVYDRLLTGASWSFEGPDGPFSVRVDGPIHVNNTEGVRAAVLAGMGIGYMPVWHFVDGEIDDGRLVVLLKDFEPRPQPISAVYPSRRHLPARVRAATDYFSEEFRNDRSLQT